MTTLGKMMALILVSGSAGQASGPAPPAASAPKPMTYSEASFCYSIYGTTLDAESFLKRPPSDYSRQVKTYMDRAEADAFELGLKAGMTRAQIKKDMRNTANKTVDRFMSGEFDKAGNRGLEEYHELCAALIDRHTNPSR